MKPQPLRAIPNPEGRIAPHHPDAEAAVLSAVLIDPRLLEQLRDLEPRHFFGEPNHRVWEAILAVVDEGRALDLVSVAAWLRDRERLQSIGGPAYLGALVDATPAIAHVGEHAALVLDAWRRRQAIAICQRAQAEGYGDIGTTAEWLDELEAKVAELVRHGGGKSKPELAGRVLEAQLVDIIATAEGKGSAPGVLSGLTDLDAFTGGWKGGQLVLIAARPGVGKSSLAHAIGAHIAERGDGVLLLTLEMSRAEVIRRIIAQRSGVPEKRIARADLTPDEWSKITALAHGMARMPLWLDDTSSLSLRDVKSRARWAASECARRGIRLGLVVVDYLQLVDAGLDPRANRNEQVSVISRALKSLARELDVPVIALSQLSRALEARSVKDKRPQLSDLRDSGSLEQDADQVLMLYREGYQNPGPPQDTAEVLIRKGRSIGTGTINVRWDGSTCSFGDERRGWEKG